MGTDTGSGMRGFVYVLAVLFATGFGLPAYASAPSSIVFVTGTSVIPETDLNCQRPAEQDSSDIETAVHPIWQVDADKLELDLGYIADDYIAASDVTAALLESGTDSTSVVAQESMGVRLDNGWSLGFTYELLDARFKVGPFLLPEPGDPVFEGPKFVATVKFR